MMKNSRKIFLSACVATMVASSAHAVTGGGIPFNDKDLIDENKNGNYSFVVDKDTGSTYNITSIIGSSFDGKTNKYINHLNIDAAKTIFNIDGSKQDAEIGYYYAKNEGKDKFYSFNIKAQELIFNGKDASLNVGDRGIIEGDLTLKDKANLFISNGTLGHQSANGSLLVKGNFTANDANLEFYGNHGFHITGTAIIRNSNFSASNAPISENGIFLLSADKGFNKDIELTNTANVFKEFSTAQLLGLSAEEAKKYNDAIVKINLENKLGINYSLKAVGNTLYINAKVDKNGWKSAIKREGIAAALRTAQKEILTAMIAEYEKLAAEATGPKPRNNKKQDFTGLDYNHLISQLNAKLDAIESGIANKTTAFNYQVDAVLASVISSNKEQAAASAIVDAITGNAQQAKNVVNSARESANNSNRQGAIQVINLANEMAIATRMMQPRSQGENSVWANAFGGVNMIGSENDSVFGTSIGIDRQFSDAILAGAYLTYADSKLNYNSVSQDADNLQIGAYSRIKNNNHEFDIKAYAQFSWTDQERLLNGTSNKSDYTQTFFGASGTYGYVFDMGNEFAIKPLIGLNLYYSNTPDYTETGVWAQHVQSMTSFTASAELGAEFRKSFENGFFYITPKVEQFFATSGDDYHARFVGSDMSFNVAGAEKDKTFGKILVGSNINITNSLSLDLSIGAKQILAGKEDDTDETYLTGNIGLKYSF
ncbi:autotransporter outer membrane beta-barrel domain-containing protein [Campylobacter lari]|nr:autotransporter outer membrane beta-barrel domain-containing protein [Campylobacter lari]